MLGLPDTDTFNFTLNGVEIQMTVGQVKAIGVAIANHVQYCIDAASSVRPSIANGTLTTEEEVEMKRYHRHRERCRSNLPHTTD